MPLFEDVITLGAGHSMIIGNLPDSIGLNQFSNDCFNHKPLESYDSFGLFGSTEYNTYYPDVDPKDFNPSSEDFIEPVFRMLSAGIVARNWSPTDFSREGVLKNSMNLLLGQTVNCDHETNIANAIGSVKEVYWQDSYTINKNGKKILVPAGINAKLRIDGKANPRIARGILMDPPSIHSNSVTVRFLWEKSHPEMEDRDFWYKLGEVDKDGRLICKVATKIIGYYETSLVSHGADPFAQKIDDKGRIINPEYAANQSYSDKSTNKPKYFFADYKNLSKEDVLHNTMVFNNDMGNNNDIPKHKENMDELKKFIESLFGDGLLALSEGKQPTSEEVISCIKSLVSSNSNLESEITSLKDSKTKLESEVSQLKSEIDKNKPFIEVATNYLSEVRKQVTDDYRKLMDKDVDESMITLISNAELSTLKSLGNSYKVQLENKFPMTCEECGSHKVSRASSVTDTDDNHNDEKKENYSDPSDNRSLINTLRKKQSRKSKEE